MPRVPLGTTFPARETARDFEFEFTRPSRRAIERELAAPQPPRARKRRSRRGAVSPLGVTGRPAGQAPSGQARTREEIPGPTPPEVSVDLTKLSPSAEVERNQAVSAALLKSAAFVQPSSVSGTLQGLLSGLGIGMEIDAAMEQYRNRKRSAAESARSRKLIADTAQRPPMRSNYGRSPDHRYSMPGVA